MINMKEVGQCIHAVLFLSHPSSWLPDLQFMTATLDDRCILNVSSHNMCNTCPKFVLAYNTVKDNGVHSMKFSLYFSSRCTVQHTIP